MSQTNPPVDHQRIQPFFAPEPGAAYAQVAEAHVYAKKVSQGEVTRPELFTSRGKPRVGGLFCARLFGPVKDDSCTCGFVRGDPSKRGTSCPKCKVPIGPASMRDERWGHIELAWPLLHPAVAPEMAAALGWSETELRSVLSYDALVEEDGNVILDEDIYSDPNDRGLTALERVAEARGVSKPWLMSRLPVPPPGSRPLQALLQNAGRWGPPAHAAMGPVNGALHALVKRNERVKSLLKLEEPIGFVAVEIRALQKLFEQALHVLGLPPEHPERNTDTVSLWEPVSAAVEPPFWAIAQEPEGLMRLHGEPAVSPPDEREILLDAPLNPVRPRGLSFVGPDRLLLQLGYAQLLLEVASGRVLWQGPATEYDLIGSVGERVFYGQRYGRQYDDGALVGAAVLDFSTLSTGGAASWLDRYPIDLPAIFVEKDEPEDAWLFDWHARRIADVEEDCSGDRPHEIARTPDHRFIWVSSSNGDGAVMCTESAYCQLLLSAMELGEQQAPHLSEDGLDTTLLGGWESAETGPADGWKGGAVKWDGDDSYLDEYGAVAIARGSDKLWRILDCMGGVSVDGSVRFRLPFLPSASAFTSTGRWLAAASAHWLILADVDDPALVHGFDLQPLAPALGVRRPKGISMRTWDVLLAAHGTPANVLAQPDRILKRLPGMGPVRIKALRQLEAQPMADAFCKYLKTKDK